MPKTYIRTRIVKNRKTGVTKIYGYHSAGNRSKRAKHHKSHLIVAYRS